MGAWGLRVAAAGMRCMNADPYLFSLGTQMGASAEQHVVYWCWLLSPLLPACLVHTDLLLSTQPRSQ